MNQTSLVYICFFLSGISALVYEIAWSRMLTTVFGSSLYAVATITAVFLGGLALGAILAGKNVHRLKKSKLAVYSLIESGVALWALVLSVFLTSDNLQPVWFALESVMPNVSYVTRFVFSCVALLPPTILMGATLPLLVASLPRSARTTQGLYAINTTGGAVGALLAGFFLLPSIGLLMTSVSAVFLNIVAAALAFAAGRIPAAAMVEAVADPKSKSQQQDKLSPFTVSSIAFFSGLILLMLEVCWTRWFSLLLGSSVYSLSCVLCVFLIGLAKGAWLAQRFLQRIGNHALLMATAYFLSAIYLLIVLYAANELPWLFLWLSQTLAKVFGAFTFEVSLLSRFIMVSLLVGPPVVLLGTVIPLLLGADAENKPAYVGRVYGINTIGAILGSLITGFLLIPSLSDLAGSGIQWTLLIVICAQIFLAVWVFMEWTRAFIVDPDTRLIVNGIAVFVTAAVVIDVGIFRPEWNPTVMSAGASFFTPTDIARLDRDSFLMSLGTENFANGQRTEFYREGLNTTVTVGSDERRNVTYLKTDGKVEAAIPTDPIQPAQGSDATTHLMLGTLPPSLVPGDQLTGLVIGYGSGATSGAALIDPRVRELIIAELEPAVYAADKFFMQSNGNPLAQRERVSALVNDGRYMLASTRMQYDLIVCQPSDPWVSGASELFTQNFWRLARARLKPDGVMSQWVQMYSLKPEYFATLCRTFSSVFPNCALVYPAQSGECILLGFNGETAPSPQRIVEGLKLDPSAKNVQLPASYRSLAGVLHSSTVVDAAGVKAISQPRAGVAAINTDDRNVVEFAAARGAMTQQQNIDENIVLVQSAGRQPGSSLP